MKNIKKKKCQPKFNNKETEYTHFLSSLGHRFIDGGDYNAKHTYWGSRLVTSKGRQLLNSIKNMNLETLSSGEPTYWPTDRRKTPDLIDFCVIRGFSKRYFAVSSCLELSSDHSPVIINMFSQIQIEDSLPTLTNKRTNWDLFRTQITNTINCSVTIHSEADIVEAVEHFNKCIQHAAWDSTPQSDNISRKKKHVSINY